MKSPIQKFHIWQGVNFIKGDDNVDIVCTHLLEKIIGGAHLFGIFRMADVHDMDQQVGITDLIQGTLKRSDQIMRQFVNQSYGI